MRACTPANPIVSVFVGTTAWRVIRTSVLSLVDSAQLSADARQLRVALVSETDPGFEFEAGYWRESWQAPAPTQPKAATPAGALHRLTVWVRDPQTQARGVWQGLWQAGEPPGSLEGWWSVQVIDE